MKFELNPQLIVNGDEYNILYRARQLCEDMDMLTTIDDLDNIDKVGGCEICPLKKKCSRLANECVFVVAKDALQKIIEIAVIK